MNKEMNRLENWRKNEINSLSNYSVLDQPFPEWENFLTLDYWKDWRNKISNFQTEKELKFYTQRIEGIADAIWNWKKNKRTEARDLFKYHYSQERHGKMRGMSSSEMIKQEELELQSIDWEVWKKEYRFSSEYLKINELSVEKALNDPWFSNKIDEVFGLNGKNNNENNVVYTNGKRDDKLTKKLLEALKQQTISKINAIKADETLTSSEKQEKLQENQARLEKLNSIIANNNNNNNNNNPSWPMPVMIGGGIGLVALLGLIVYKLRMKRIRR